MTNHPAKTSFFYWQGQLYDPGQFTFIRTVSSLKFELLCHYKSGINPQNRRRGELKVQNEHETLGEIIKNARMKADITVEDLATKVGVTERFIYRIENEGKKPSYDILYKLIRELSILPDQIFFPEKQIEDSEMESLVRMLYNCDERSMQIIKATVRAALDSQPKE